MFCDRCDLAMPVDEHVRTTSNGDDLCESCWDDAKWEGRSDAFKKLVGLAMLGETMKPRDG